MRGTTGGFRRILTAVTALAILAPITAADARGGDLDLTFGVGGIAFAGFDQAVGFDVAVRSDGRIVAAGAGLGRGFVDMALARFTKGGTRDKSFSKDGRVMIDVGEFDLAQVVFPGPGASTTVVGVSIDGLFQDDLSSRVIAARLNGKGRLDKSFGEGGVLIADPYPENGREELLAGAALGEDGSLLIAGTAVTFIQTPSEPEPEPVDARPFLAKYDPTGMPDLTFGVGGVATFLTDPMGSVVSGMTVDPAGNIVAVGTAPDREELTVWRFLPNGVPDPTFGPGGVVSIDLGSANAGPTAVTTAGQDIFVAAVRGTGGARRWAVARFDATGVQDRSFGKNGLATIAMGSNGAPADIGIHRKRIWLTGTSVDCTVFCIPGGSVARLRMNGRVDKRFGVDGRAQLMLLVIGIGGIDFRGRRAMIAATVGGFTASDLGVVQLKT